MKYIVDRIEEGKALLEDDDLAHIEVSVNDLPDGVKEGSVLVFENGAYILDAQEQALRKKRIFEKQQQLFKKIKKD